MRRAVEKLLRDAVVVGVGAVLYFVGNNVADLGLPTEIAGVVSVLCLYAYRLLRGTDTTIGNWLADRDPS